jgi:hypothetical protein
MSRLSAPEDVSNVTNGTHLPSEDFFHDVALSMSDSLNHLGSVKTHLAISLLIAWLVVFLTLTKGELQHILSLEHDEVVTVIANTQYL